MNLNHEHHISCDVLVVGGGGAGLRAAIAARETGADVVLVSKSRVGYANNTYIAKASIAAAGWGDDRDNFDVHLNDTLTGGRFLNDRSLVSVMTREAKNQISFLEKCGVRFAKKADSFEIGHVAGCRYPRHIRGKNRIGSELLIPLKAYANQIGVRMVDRVFVTRLFASDNCIGGASGVSGDGVFVRFSANCVILATGGFAQAYLHTNNAAGITGDGQALAFDLGVSLKDMEFVQFYPTALGKMGNRVLLYEAFVLNAGATLKNAKGEDIVMKHGLDDPMRLTRDRLAQAVIREIMSGRDVDGGVVLDISPIAAEKIEPLRQLLPLGWSPDQKTFIVSPTAHFCMGGVCIDMHTETSLSGLFAVGEVCAGIHGANRLAGNALCEVFAMGSVAGKNAALRARDIGSISVPENKLTAEKDRLESFFKQGKEEPSAMTRLLKMVMWRQAGIVRHQKDLKAALDRIEELKTAAFDVSIQSPGDLIRQLELNNLLLVSEMVCRTGLMRTESRGSHFRSDYPEEDDVNWLKNIVIRKAALTMKLEPVPVAME